MIRACAEHSACAALPLQDVIAVLQDVWEQDDYF
jgi:hypothetical protein